ncbi:hypothetical protein [Cohnella kolymensis]|uniref:hypothetical protein n=1 Tax=Cohnella kolymensis TaxID=1590652 RepID=UPI000AB4FF14|nr:hypothetical protein [Cohnella kolymensis]
MSEFMKENKQPTTDLATVESQRNDLTAEEFPEGPYGSPMAQESLGKSTPWRDDQRPPNTFTYENRALHAGRDRDYPGDHDTHAENGGKSHGSPPS